MPEGMCAALFSCKHLIESESGSGSGSEGEESEGTSSDEGDTLTTLQKRFGVVPKKVSELGLEGGGVMMSCVSACSCLWRELLRRE